MLSAVASLSLLSIPVRSVPADLKEQTLAAWNEYIHWVSLRSEMRVKQSPFLWISELPPRRAEVHAGYIPVWRQAADQSTKVPHGLIHDWMGAVFIPKATISDVLAVTRNYDHYAEIYQPAVVEAKELSSAGLDDRFSMTLMRKALFVTAAVKGEYEARYVQVDANHWYSISRSTRLQAIENFGQPDMRVLPADQGPGYVWRIYNFARFEQNGDGVYIETEALGLSRDVPTVLRWLVDPVIEQVARNSIRTTLEETRKAALLKFSSVSNRSEAKGKSLIRIRPLPPSGLDFFFFSRASARNRSEQVLQIVLGEGFEHIRQTCCRGLPTVLRQHGRTPSSIELSQRPGELKK